MSHKRIYFILAFVLPVLIESQGTHPFQIGETLLYDASINFIKAGSAKLQVSSMEPVNDRPSYHIVFSFNTNKVLDRLFKIRDEIETWIDVEHLFTRKFRKRLRERNYKKDFTAEMNYEDSVVVSGNKSYAIRRELRDPYSLFYYLRTLPLRVGDLHAFTTFDNNKFTDFQVTVHRIEKVKVPAGEFNCFVIEPFREGRSLFKSQGDMTIWFSDDEKRLPVKVVSKAKFGSIVMKLRSLGSTVKKDG